MQGAYFVAPQNICQIEVNYRKRTGQSTSKLLKLRGHKSLSLFHFILQKIAKQGCNLLFIAPIIFFNLEVRQNYAPYLTAKYTSFDKPKALNYKL